MLLLLLSACVITNADLQKRVDFDGDGYLHWQLEGGDDCDDADPDIHPGAVEACDGVDSDCDGVPEDLTDADGDGVTVCGGDCDDDDPERTPGQVEACDGVDNDCDDVVDEGLPESTFYRDADQDGYGDAQAPPQLACFPPAGYVEDDGDCDDSDHSLNPDTLWYRDLDGDGAGDETSTRQSCEEPEVPGVGYVREPGDCDDDDPESYPGRAEVGTVLACNGVDNDCDPTTEPDELVDMDGDGAPLCSDCDDDDPHVYPDLVWWLDGDGDGYGTGSQQVGCPGAVSFATVDGDCDDGAPLVSSTAFTIDGTADLNAILAQVCPATTITLASGTQITQDLTFGQGVTLVAEGSATLVGNLQVLEDVDLQGVDVEGRVEVQNAALTWEGASLEGHFETTGGRVDLSNLVVTMATEGTVFSGTQVELVDVSFGGVLGDMVDAVLIEDAAADSSLLRVQIAGSGQPMEGRAGLLLTASGPGSDITVENLLVTDTALGIEITEQPATLKFVTVADYFAQGIVIGGHQQVHIQDTLVGRPQNYIDAPPPNYGAIRVDGAPVVTFDTTYTFISSTTVDPDGAAVTDGTGAFAACEAQVFAGAGAPRCEVVTRDDDVSSDLTVALPMMMESPFEFLYGRTAAPGVDCPGLDPPGPDNGSPDDCFQPGYYGGINAPPPP